MNVNQPPKIEWSDLEQDCGFCGGDRFVTDYNNAEFPPPNKPCPRCDATGAHPTETGANILRLLNRYGKMEREEAS